MNDITTSLENNLDIQEVCSKKKLKIVSILKHNSTRDICTDKGNKLDIRKQKYIKIIKNNTKNFDSLIKTKKLKTIYLYKNLNIARKFGLKPENSDIKKYLKILIGEFNKKCSIFNKKKFCKIEKNKSPIKNLGILLIFFLFIFLVNKILVEKLVNSGYARILSIKEEAININNIKKQLNDAKLDFIIADILFKPFLLIPTNEIRNGYHAISGGKKITKIGDELLQIYTEISKLGEKKGIENINLTNLILNSKNDFLEMIGHLENILYHYKEISFINSNKLDIKLRKQIKNLEQILKLSRIINSNFDNLMRLLGAYREQKYLVIFQNNDEIRPTGGFMGSMAILSINSGKIKSFEPKDVYAYEWNLKKSDHKRLKPPKAIEKLTNTFGLRDANYFASIKDSSKSIKYFIEKSGYKVDSIIYLNQNTILDFLGLFGEVKSESIGETINKDNFSRVMSTLVESKISKKGTLGTPKQTLFNFIEEFRVILKEKAYYIGYISIILDNIKNREIIIYSFDEGLNKTLSKLGLNGEIKYDMSLDFSYPIFTSISGNKTDRYIKRKYEKIIMQNPDCSIDTSLNIFLSHLFTKKEEKEIENILEKYDIKQNKSELIKVQGKGDNYSFVKLILPKNAKIEKNRNVKVVKLKDKQVLEFFMRTRVLETTNFLVKYSLENESCKKYDFRFYKQAGLKSYEFEIFDNNKVIKKSGIKGDYYYN